MPCPTVASVPRSLPSLTSRLSGTAARLGALRSIRRVVAVCRCKKPRRNRSNHVVVVEAHSPIPAEIAVVELWYC
jgi:hypothetical protein